MISLERITDKNLISARSHGVEIEIESMCEWLEAMDRHEGLPIWSGAMESMLHSYQASLREVVMHAWPMPSDPVVVALCAWAHAGLECFNRLRCRVKDAAPVGHKDYGRGTATSERANFIV